MPSKPSITEVLDRRQARSQVAYGVVDAAALLDEEAFLFRLDELVKFTTRTATDFNELGTRLGLIHLLWHAKGALRLYTAPNFALDLVAFRAERLSTMAERLREGVEPIFAAVDDAETAEGLIKAMQYPAEGDPATVGAMTVAAAVGVRAVAETLNYSYGSLWPALSSLLASVIDAHADR